MNLSMKTIHKQISLEALKCRIPNTLPSIRDNAILYPDEENFYYENPNGNYGSIPCDIRIPTDKIIGNNNEEYDVSTITDITNTNINIPDESSYYKESEKKYSNSKITINGEENFYFSYHKLHEWYLFYTKYFERLYTTTCRKSDKVYKSAVEYFYSDNPKEEFETLEYFQNIDKLFIARGGVIQKNSTDNPTHCDFYDWLKKYVFLSFDLKTESYVNANNKTVYLKQYAKEWKTTTLNIISLFQWYKWFYVRYTDDENLDCCKKKEYERLGGENMYFFFDKCVKEYYKNAEYIKNFSTFSATINIPLLLQNTNNIIGEYTSLIENWEGGEDYSPKNNGNGTVVHYGGTTYLYNDDVTPNEDPNKTITIEDTTFIATNSGDTTVKKGYFYNQYKEFTFLYNKKPIYGEYIQEYIKKNNDEFVLDELDGVTNYSYLDSKFVPNPNIDNMSIKNKILTHPLENGHIFYIDNDVYFSSFGYILKDSNNNPVCDEHSEIIVQYVNDDEESIPFVIYRGKKYYGYYDKSQKHNFKFTFKRKICDDSDWLVISEEKVEYIIYNNVLYEVENNKITLPNGSNITTSYESVEGIVSNDVSIVLIGKKDKTYFYGNLVAFENPNDAQNTIYRITEGDGLGELITVKEEWTNKNSGYWIDVKDGKPTTLSLIKPYTVYNLGVVTGKTKSKLVGLEDFNKSYDKQGNEIHGLYTNTFPIPRETDILDFYYHVGNVSDLQFIVNDTEAKIGYYWGNMISNITFYFKKDNGDIIKEVAVSSTNNISALEKNIKEYIKETFFNNIPTNIKNPQIGDLCINGNDIYLITQVSKEDINEYKASGYIKLEKLDEIISALPTKPLCKITYNFGAIIERPYNIVNGKYNYGQYSLSSDYHHGVEYTEEFSIEIGVERYYLEKDTFTNVKYLQLIPLNEVTYYMDDIITEDSEEFTANSANFKTEVVHNLAAEDYDEKKYTKEYNSSESDGRQFNFYNGLMASPNMIEEYNLGISSLRKVEDDIYINRGINYAFDKHIKLMEVKSLEALEQYGNGSFNIINNG